MESSDERLAKEARDGSVQAFEQLFRRHHPMIHRFAYRLCGNETDAADVAQETFVSAARGLTQFKGGTFRSWLCRIALNKAHDLGRDAAKREQAQQAAVELASAQEKSGPESSEVRKLRAAMERLSSGEREVLLLVFYEEMSHAEAARVCGCAETTVSWRLFNGKRKLKRFLRKSGGGSND